MNKIILLAGQKFGSWTVLSFSGKSKHNRLMYLCKCDCGNESIVSKSALLTGKSIRCRSCGHSKYQVKIGQKFSRWTIIKKVTKNPITYLCQCDCGNTKIISQIHLIKGHTKSCGCLRKEMLINNENTHHKSQTKIYSVWYSMKERCFKQRQHDYKYYGGRGITICNEWKNDFMNFYNWSMDNGYKEGLTIDRIDVNGNYEPSNCRWVDRKKQANNTRRNRFIIYKKQKHTVSDWADIIGIKKSILLSRIRKGLPLYKCFYKGKLSNNGVDLL